MTRSTTTVGPVVASVGYLVVASVAVLVIGWAVFRRFEPRLAEEL